MPARETEIIVSFDGAEQRRLVVEPGEYFIGRDSESHVQVDAEWVSPRHAKLRIDADSAFIEDLGSSSGTLVNGELIKSSTRLRPGQEIQIGTATLVLRRIQPAADSDATLPPVAAAVRRLLPEKFQRGRKYDIGSVVARGGMGEILDVREATTDRTVAMKVMLDDATEEDISRFITEARVTARLEHPNIVPVHELGVDENGQPFYTMKMVRGTTLRKVIEMLAAGDGDTARKFPLPILLTVFQKVCDAVAFAHSRGIIHRDLKPENIMLGDFGEVLVMDWGLAKKLRSAERGVRNDGADVSATSKPFDAEHPAPDGATMAGTALGTPQYMSPEQARGEVGTLDERSDIWSLGAILHHLLALRPPVDGGSAMEVIGRVGRGEVEPLAAGEFKIQNSKFNVPQSLAAVVRKAMAFERDGRYASVADLQQDIAAYQGGFATSAEDAGAWKQFTLFLRRHRALAASVAASLLLIVVLFTLFTVRVIRERNRAERGEKTAERALAVSQHARQTAEGLIESMLYDLRDKLQPLGRLDLLNDISRQAEDYFRKFPAGGEVPKEVHNQNAMLHNRGKILLQKGDLKGARESFERAREAVIKLVEQNPRSIWIQRDLCVSDLRMGDLAEAEGNHQAAREFFEQALEISMRVAKTSPDLTEAQSDLATSYERVAHAAKNTGDMQTARRACSESLAILAELARLQPEDLEHQNSIGACHATLAAIARAEGKIEEAIQSAATALAIYRKLVHSAPGNSKFQRNLSGVLQNLADYAEEKGDAGLEKDYMHEAVEIRRQHTKSDPTNTVLQIEFATQFLLRFASLCRETGDMDTAKAAIQEALGILQPYASGNFSNLQLKLGLSCAYGLLGRFASDRGDFVSAKNQSQASLDILHELATANPTDLNILRNTSTAEQTLGTVGKRMGDFAAARAAYQRALDMDLLITARLPKSVLAQSRLLISYSMVATTARIQRDRDAARDLCQKALDVAQHINPIAVGSLVVRTDIGLCLTQVAEIAFEQGDSKSALAAYRKGRELGRQLVSELPGQSVQAVLFSEACRGEAAALAKLEPNTPAAVLRKILEEGRAPLARLKQSGRLPTDYEPYLMKIEVALAELGL